MIRPLRLALLGATVMLAAAVALASQIPSPFFPPDPWGEEEKTGGNLAASSIPSPFFPPDPWGEEENKGGGGD